MKIWTSYNKSCRIPLTYDVSFYLVYKGRKFQELNPNLSVAHATLPFFLSGYAIRVDIVLFKSVACSGKKALIVF